MADSENQQPVDTTQQVTSKTPATKQKNPKRVAAGKAVAERTKMAREAQKKAFIEAQSMVAKNQVKQADPPPDTTSPPDTPPTKNVLTTTQWLSVISIVVSLAGIYYIREAWNAWKISWQRKYIWTQPWLEDLSFLKKCSFYKNGQHCDNDWWGCTQCRGFHRR